MAEHQFTTRMNGTLTDYHRAPGGEGPLAAAWKDKPHRLLYDLLGEVQALRAELADTSATFRTTAAWLQKKLSAAESERDDWHKVADDRSAEINRLLQVQAIGPHR